MKWIRKEGVNRESEKIKDRGENNKKRRVKQEEMKKEERGRGRDDNG